MSMSTYLLKPIRNHVANSPTLVFYKVAQGCEENAVASLLLLRNDFGNGNKDLDCQ